MLHVKQLGIRFQTSSTGSIPCICPFSHAVDRLVITASFRRKNGNNCCLLGTLKDMVLCLSTRVLSNEAVNMVVRACRRVGACPSS